MKFIDKTHEIPFFALSQYANVGAAISRPPKNAWYFSDFSAEKSQIIACGDTILPSQNGGRLIAAPTVGVPKQNDQYKFTVLDLSAYVLQYIDSFFSCYFADGRI